MVHIGFVWSAAASEKGYIFSSFSRRGDDSKGAGDSLESFLQSYILVELQSIILLSRRSTDAPSS